MNLALITSAICICLVYSLILWKDNLGFRFAEHTLIGLALANLTVMSINTIITKGVTPTLQGSYLTIIPIILGLIIFTRISKEYGWISRIPMAVLIGTGIGLGMRGSAEVSILKQIEATALPLIGGKLTPIDNLVIIIGTISSLMYFLFTFGFRGPASKQINYIRTIGRYIMMVAFGAVFGNTLMTRMVWITARIDTVLQAILSLI